jgi:hypothetical protein
MRYSRQHKDETHNRLLKKAAEEFRRRAVQGTGIASLMRPDSYPIVIEAAFQPRLPGGIRRRSVAILAAVVASGPSQQKGKSVRDLSPTYCSG